MNLDISRQVSLQTCNTLGLEVLAEYFCQVTSLDSLRAALNYAHAKRLKVRILGGGSNVVLQHPLDGLVIHIALKGLSYTEGSNPAEGSSNLAEGSSNPAEGSSPAIIAEAGAGESWHNFVRTCLRRGYSGLENLSLIPGLVGAAPIQNIGAYGVELSDRFISLQAIDVWSGEEVRLTSTDCAFGYRHSVFKDAAQDQFVITSVSLNLDSTFTPILDYAELQAEFAGCAAITALAVSDAVIRIRQNKLPDPDVLGNVGSFFKNPVLSKQQWQLVKDVHPHLTANALPTGKVKLSAARLIDRCGLKGLRVGGAAISDQHALVIVNQGHAAAEDVCLLAHQVVEQVRKQYNITLEVEPVWF